MQIQAIELGATKCQISGVGGDRFSALLEGAIHEFAHIAAIEIVLGEKFADVGLKAVCSGDHVWTALDALDEEMSSVYSLRTGDDYRAFIALSDRLEIFSAAATYLVLHREGLCKNALKRFDVMWSGGNSSISNYPERCAQRLRDPRVGRIADLTETLLTKFAAKSS